MKAILNEWADMWAREVGPTAKVRGKFQEMGQITKVGTIFKKVDV